LSEGTLFIFGREGIICIHFSSYVKSYFMNFVETLKLPTSTLKVDIANKTLMCSFVGDIQLSDYKGVLLAAVDQVAEHGITNIMMNRLDLKELPPECRIWVKSEYLKNHIKPHIPNLNKVAVVESKSILGALYGKAIYQMLSFIYPSLSFRFFDNVDEALSWFQNVKYVKAEQLKQDDDMELLEAGSEFNTSNKTGWVNKILDYLFR
jgi:hypothetical protein